MKALRVAQDAAELVALYADKLEGLREAQAALDRYLAWLRSLDAPSSLLLALKREGGEALNRRSKRRSQAAEAARAAVDQWKRHSWQGV